MKKIYNLLLSSICLVLLSNNSYAQVFPESFEGTGFPPTGWVSFDNGIGTTQSWTTTATAQSGSMAAFVRYETVTGTAEDWLVSPSVSITAGNHTLSFWEREGFTIDYGTTYNILVSASSQTNVATFSVVASYPENTVTPTVYRNNLIDLSAYIGQTVSIAFRMDNNNGDDWYLDNIDLIAPCTTPPSVGTISGPITATNGSVSNYTVTPTVGNVNWYTGVSSTGPWTAISGATTAVNQPITASGSGTVFLTVIASTAGCPDDTANVSYQVVVNFPNDVCDFVPLTIGASTVQYNLFGATAQTGEVVPLGGGCSTNDTWCNTTLDNTRWFSFVAPTSGFVTVQSPGFDTQLAVWKAASCSDLLSASTATLIGANDDDTAYVAHGGVQYSSFVRAACLTPGATYYIQLDSYGPTTSTSSTKVIVMDMGTALDASFTGLAANYCTVDPTATLTPVTIGGLFTLNTSTTSISQFDPTAGVGTYTVNYSIFGCVTSSITMVSVCSGVKEISSSSNIVIYPNPNNGIVNISINNTALVGNSTLEIYDAIGKLVMTETLTKESNTINTAKLETGIYMIKIINKNQEVKVSKMIKQ